MNKMDPDSLPDGYQMTELGPLPADWQVVRLGEVASVLMGQSPPSETYNSNGLGLPFMQGKAEFTEIYPKPIKWCSHPQRISPVNAILLSVRAPVGDVNIAPFECCIGRGLAAICATNRTDHWFMFYWLKLAKPRLEEMGSGTTFKSINRDVLANFPIPLPPLPEQRAIAHVLRTVQEAREATERVIAALRALKKSLMRHLFTYGPVPLDQTDQVVLKETEIGLMPAHWQVVRLGEVGKVITGRTPPTNKSEYWNGAIPFITPVDLEGGAIRTAHRSITMSGLGKAKPLPKGTVLVSCIGYIGKVGIVDTDIAATNQQINAIVPENVHNLFLAYALMQESSVLEALSRMTTVPILHKTNFERVPIPLPPLPEQQEIARILQAVDARIQSEERYRQALEALFKTLLHELMTGRRRVPERYRARFAGEGL